MGEGPTLPWDTNSRFIRGKLVGRRAERGTNVKATYSRLRSRVQTSATLRLRHMASSRGVPCPGISSAVWCSTRSASNRPSRRTVRSWRDSSPPPAPLLRVSPDLTPPLPLKHCLAAPASDPRAPLCSKEGAGVRRSGRGEVLFTHYPNPSSPSLPTRQATHYTPERPVKRMHIGHYPDYS